MNIRTFVVVCLLLIVLCAEGCAFGDRKVSYQYTPVMKIKTDHPVTVAVATFSSERKPGNPKQIGQIRNVYGMVTAKVLCVDGDPMIWIADALASELKQAGYEVIRVDSESQSTAPVTISGSVNKFFMDMNTQITLSVSSTFHVRGENTVLLDETYKVDEGAASVTASSSFYTELTRKALERLMRRAFPSINESIDDHVH